MRWVEITVSATDASADAVANILIDEGCGGSAINRTPDMEPNGEIDVMGYLPVDDRLEGKLISIKARVKELPGLGLDLTSDEITVKWVEDEDWGTAWKKYFKPLPVGKIVIKPTWEEYEPKPGDIILEIDPGMAFGTGSHATTQLCMLALQDYIKGGETVLDMGTGSGILAISARLLGAEKIVGFDVDPLAVRIARENVERISMENVIKIDEAESPLAFDGVADVIVANIIAVVIINLAESFRAKIKTGGKLISSGIIREREDEVKEKLESVGFKTLEVRREGEWVSIISEAI